MKAKLISIPVRDQDWALTFYTDRLGFIKHRDEDLGGGNRWLTVVSPDWKEGTEILLEPAPNHFAPARVYQEALHGAGIPCTQFEVDDVNAQYERLSAEGVAFRGEPTAAGTVKYAILDDTCGNLIQLVQYLDGTG